MLKYFACVAGMSIVHTASSVIMAATARVSRVYCNAPVASTVSMSSPPVVIAQDSGPAGSVIMFSCPSFGFGFFAALFRFMAVSNPTIRQVSQARVNSSMPAMVRMVGGFMLVGFLCGCGFVSRRRLGRGVHILFFVVLVFLLRFL